MTHEERLALINRPFTITYHTSSYPWGGTIVGDRFFETAEALGRFRTPEGHYAERNEKLHDQDFELFLDDVFSVDAGGGDLD